MIATCQSCAVPVTTITVLLLLLASYPPLTVISPPYPPLRMNTIASRKSSNSSTQPILTGDIYIPGHERSHSELCPSLGADLQVVILVTSAPSHSVIRNAVRLTWGRYSTYTNVSVVFFIGRSSNVLRPLLQAEDERYGDIIVGRFTDSYSNLTLKILSMLEWVDKYCPLVPKVLKTDDDVFINIPRLLNFIRDPLKMNATRTIWGEVLSKGLPIRSKQSRIYVPKKQFSENLYPDFTRGASYLMTTDVIRDMLDVAPGEPYLRLEDVFITGVLASKIGVTLKNYPDFYAKGIINLCMLRGKIAVVTNAIREQFCCIRLLHNRNIKCKTFNVSYVTRC